MTIFGIGAEIEKKIDVSVQFVFVTQRVEIIAENTSYFVSYII